MSFRRRLSRSDAAPTLLVYNTTGASRDIVQAHGREPHSCGTREGELLDVLGPLGSRGMLSLAITKRRCAYR